MGAPLVNDTYNRWETVTPSDTVNLDGTTFSGTATQRPSPCDALHVSVTGTLTAVMASGKAVQFPVSGIGVIRIRAIRVNSTGTAATGILALYQV